MFENLFSRAGLSLDRLRSLVEVDESGGIAAAAPGDTVRQSQMSRNLSHLESFFGTELKRRKGKGIELTAEGKRLAALARSQIMALEEFATEASGGVPEIRIGGGQSVIEWLLLPLLKEHGAAKDVRFRIESMRSSEVVSSLKDFSLDLGIVRKSAIRSHQIETRRLSTVSYSLIVRKKLAERYNQDALSLLSAIPLATSMGGEYRSQFNAYLESKEIPSEIRFSCSSFRTALEILKGHSEVGALLPDTAFEELGSGFVVLPLPFLKDYRRELVFAWNKRLGDIRPSTEKWITQFASQ